MTLLSLGHHSKCDTYHQNDNKKLAKMAFFELATRFSNIPLIAQDQEKKHPLLPSSL
jgi:hypothetical protein